jgi:hypothetical protein
MGGMAQKIGDLPVIKDVAELDSGFVARHLAIARESDLESEISQLRTKLAEAERFRAMIDGLGDIIGLDDPNLDCSFIMEQVRGRLVAAESRAERAEREAKALRLLEIMVKRSGTGGEQLFFASGQYHTPAVSADDLASVIIDQSQRRGITLPPSASQGEADRPNIAKCPTCDLSDPSGFEMYRDPAEPTDTQMLDWLDSDANDAGSLRFDIVADGKKSWYMMQRDTFHDSPRDAIREAMKTSRPAPSTSSEPDAKTGDEQ